jgi:hypothetical protein
MSKGFRVIVWRDVLVISDDGRSAVGDYDELFPIAAELQRKHPKGFGCLSIIPADAIPPSDQARAAINVTLERAQHLLRGLCWCVEGVGFQAAMVRAVLTGMRFIKSAPYARNIATGLQEGLTWLLPQLDGGAKRLDDLETALAYIRDRRASLRALQSDAPP